MFKEGCTKWAKHFVTQNCLTILTRLAEIFEADISLMNKIMGIIVNISLLTFACTYKINLLIFKVQFIRDPIDTANIFKACSRQTCWVSQWLKECWNKSHNTFLYRKLVNHVEVKIHFLAVGFFINLIAFLPENHWDWKYSVLNLTDMSEFCKKLVHLLHLIQFC